MGRVGELVRASVTTKLCPSQPLVDSLSEELLAGDSRQPSHAIPTVGPPCFIFVFHDDLAQSGGKPVVIIVYYRLSDVQGRLAY